MGERPLYVRMAGKVMGPLNSAQLRLLRDRGQLRRFHEVSEDRRTWFSAADVTELFPPETARPAPAPAALETPAPQPWYYIDANQVQHGPVSREQVVAAYRAGAIDDQTLAWQSGMAQWAPLASLGLVPAAPVAAGTPVSARREPAVTAEEGAGWARVRTGLAVTLIGCFTFITMLVLIGLLVVIASTAPERPEVGPLLALTSILTAVLALASRVLQATGFGFCAASPAQSGTRGLGIAAFALAAMNAVFCLLLGFLFLSAGASVSELDWRGVLAAGHLMMAFWILDGLVILAKVLLHLLFLRGAALAVRRAGLAQGVLLLTVFYGVVVLLHFFLTLLSLVFPGAALWQEIHPAAVSDYAAGVLVCGVLLLVLWFGWLIWYVVTLFQVRAAIADYLAES
jgi:hypothetical protein